MWHNSSLVVQAKLAPLSVKKRLPRPWQAADLADSEPACGPGSSAGSSAELGSAKNPIFTMQAEPTVRSQVWRTVRTLAVMFVIISGLGALMEERGLSRGILNSPDMRPQLDGKTKFSDVKGVDEAKVC